MLAGDSNLPLPPPARPPCRPAGQNLLLALNYVHPGESALVCDAHAEWGRVFQALHPPLTPLTLADVDAAEGRPLVVRAGGGVG